MEQRLREVELAQVELKTEVRHLTNEVAALRETVSELNDTLNKGRGMLTALVFISGAIGALTAGIIKKLLGII